jgi:threonine synthase
VSSRLTHLECANCGRTHDPGLLHQRCDCGGTLLARYDISGIDVERMRERQPGMWRYRELLPVRGKPISFGESETPLVPTPHLSERLGADIYVKDESFLPGGTFKARGAAVGLSRAAELGATRVVMPTAGNAGGAWSLYAARADLQLTVVMAESAPRANQVEVTIAGAELVLVDGTIADAGGRAAAIGEETGAFLASTFSEPYRLEGKKTAFFEIFDALGGFPRTVVMPVGGGVAAIACAKAAAEAKSMGWTRDEPPRLVGVQPENCAPIVRAFDAGAGDVKPWEADPMTIAAGLRVPAPVEGALVLKTIRDSGGTMVAVSEEEIVESVRDLASTEGLFCCPEGAATLAAAQRLAIAGVLESPVLLYNTGTGVKYLDAL